MVITLEVSSKDYVSDKLAVKMALSHMETLLGTPNGYLISDPYSKFGWTFFKVAIKSELQDGIERKFAAMLDKYRWSNKEEKFTKFMTDYFASKGCSVKIKTVSSV
jgi:hypothetical protein